MKKTNLSKIFLVMLLFLSLTVHFPASAAELRINAASALLAEGDTGEVLFEQNAREKRYPASITKVMTAMLTLEAVRAGTLTMDQVVTAQPTALAGLPADGSNQDIRAGEQLTVRDLLYCTLVASANEACNILAETVAGSVDAFVERMNERAAQLGMTGTHFINAHGLHHEEHYTTAWDIFIMAREAMKDPEFRTIVSAVDYYVPETNLHAERHFYTTNALLTNWKYMGYTYRYAIGIKTGSTSAAGQCLVSAAEKNGRRVYAVVLGAENTLNENGDVTDRPSFSESKRLLEIGLDDFSVQTVLSTMDLQREVKVTLSRTEHVVAVPAADLKATLPRDMAPEDITVLPTVEECVEAPVVKGQKLGTVEVRYRDRSLGTADLVAMNDVERDRWMYYQSRIATFFEQGWVKMAIILLGLLLAGVVMLRIFNTGRRVRPQKSGGKRRRYRGKRW